MRAYYFGNMYLSSIQQGIQAAHVTAELFAHYPRYQDQENIEAQELLYEWAQNHKTMILLNAGYGETIHGLRQFFMVPDNPYPWAAFAESPEALDGALTSVGIVLPEKIYLTAAAIRNERPERGRPHRDGVFKTIREMLEDSGSFVVGKDNELGFDVDEQTIIDISKWEYDLINKLNQFGLAR